MSAKGITFLTGTFNGLVFETGANDLPIAGATLASTNIPELTASDLSFTAHSVSIKEAGVKLPSDAPGSIDISVKFAGGPPSFLAGNPQTSALDTTLLSHG
jgi:hypothetical protein